MSQSQGAASPGGAASSHLPRTWRHCPPKALEEGRTGLLPPPYLPEHEADWVHHCGLDDLSAREDAPGDRIGLQLRGVGDVFTLGGVGRSRLGVQTAAVLSLGARTPIPLSTPQLCSSVTSHKPESQKSSWPFLSSVRGANQLLFQWFCSLPLMSHLARPLCYLHHQAWGLLSAQPCYPHSCPLGSAPNQTQGQGYLLPIKETSNAKQDN